MGYWRLLSMDPQAAKAIVCSQKPTIQDDTNLIETNLLDELVANLSNLASVYHKRPSAFTQPYGVAQQEWLARWAEMPVPGPNATVMDIKGFPMHDVSAVEGALKAARFCVV